jgi:hypothetical protein
MSDEGFAIMMRVDPLALQYERGEFSEARTANEKTAPEIGRRDHQKLKIMGVTTFLPPKC